MVNTKLKKKMHRKCLNYLNIKYCRIQSCLFPIKVIETLLYSQYNCVLKRYVNTTVSQYVTHIDESPKIRCDMY